MADARDVARLHINNRVQEGESGARLADARQAVLPLLLHAAPRRALFLGVGTGITAVAAAEDRDITVDAVELLPEVLAVAPYFTSPIASDDAARRLRLVTADARRFVRTTPTRYDVIVADNFHPARSGSGALYTIEHFAAVRERLAAGGVFCQWLPLHQLDLATLAIIVHSFQHEFPRAYALLATNSLETPVVGLVAHADGAAFDAAALHARLARADFETPPANLGIADELALLGSFVAGPESLARFAAQAPLNTDDRPIVAYRAPRLTYAPAASTPSARLLAFMDAVAIAPHELLETARADMSERLAAYWLARDRFLEAGRNITATSDVRAMLAQVREPLLAVLAVSPEFRPAYDPLLQMALALARVDEAAARALLDELERAQPARSEAALARRDLGL